LNKKKNIIYLFIRICIKPDFFQPIEKDIEIPEEFWEVIERMVRIEAEERLSPGDVF
jgi:hypothetical protein